MGANQNAARVGAGFSLLEVLIALAILGFGLLSLAAMQIHAMREGSTSRYSSDAARIARDQMEQIQRMPFATVGAAAGLDQRRGFRARTASRPGPDRPRRAPRCGAGPGLQRGVERQHGARRRESPLRGRGGFVDGDQPSQRQAHANRTSHRDALQRPLQLVTP